MGADMEGEAASISLLTFGSGIAEVLLRRPTYQGGGGSGWALEQGMTSGEYSRVGRQPRFLFFWRLSPLLAGKLED